MTPAQQAFVLIDKEYSSLIKPWYERQQIVLEALEAEGGIGSHFQDDEGTVYETVRPEYKAQRMIHFDVNRTRREGEEKGSLSLKRAKELGYELPQDK